MKKNYTIFFLVLAVILAVAFWLLTKEKITTSQSSRLGNIVKEIRINDHIFSTEVIMTPEKRALGLSGRRELCFDCAMLFVFEKPGNSSFWMKDMIFDLDIIWILSDEIMGIDKNVSHERGSAEIVRPQIPVDKVLEINAGGSDRLNLKVGDKVEFSKDN